MPLHNKLTIGDLLSLALTALYFYQPGVDRVAVWEGLCDRFFGGDWKRMAGWAMFWSHKVVEWGLLCLMGLVYALRIPAIEKYKILSTKPWPWYSSDEKQRKEYAALCFRAIRYMIILHVCVTALTYVLADAADPLAADISTFPSKWQVFWQCSAGTVITEGLNYWAHRLVHTKWLYWCHKQHHEWKDTCVLATFYVSFWDMLLTDIIPGALPVVLFNMHVYTQIMFTVPLVVNAICLHSGYRLPYGFCPLVPLPFCTHIAETHDVHHRAGNVNFGGAYLYWDWVFGTLREPKEFEEKWLKWTAKKEARGKRITQSDAECHEFHAQEQQQLSEAANKRD